MKSSQLTKKIKALSEKLKPVASTGVRIDFSSFTEPEQFVLLKNFELTEKYHGQWTNEAIFENIDLIVKGNQIVIRNMIELFEFMMPRALMLDEVQQYFFKFNFHNFLRCWIECHEHLRQWSSKDREDFLREMKEETQTQGKDIREVELNGKENGD